MESHTVTIEKIRRLKGDHRIRIERTLVYEGTVDWLIKTLEQSFIQGVEQKTFPVGSTLSCTEESIVDLELAQQEQEK